MATTTASPRRSQSSTSLRSEGLDSFAGFCSELTLENGTALELHQYQRVMLADYFAGATETLILISKKNGKALALDTPIATPDGWTEMGELAVGDSVFGPDGEPTAVVATTEPMLGRSCFRVVFNDGESIVADADHLWLTDDRNAGERVRTTAEIAATLVNGQGFARHRVPVAAALDLPDADLLVDPYTLGVWLGDGHTACGRVTNIDPEVWEAIPYSLGPPTADGMTRTVLGLKVDLRSLGVLGHKHVPPVYLRASRRQRLALLRGLMDTDGTISARGLCEFDTTNSRLVADVEALITTLGWKSNLLARRAQIDGRDVGPKWTIQFTAFCDVPVFTIARKVARQKTPPPRRTRSQVRLIHAVEPVASVPVRCIEVARADGLYLAGTHLVTTHNSTLLSALALYHLVVTPDAECVIAAASRDQAQIMLRQARGFIRRSETLQRLMVVKQREITSLVCDGRIRVLASDVDTADGVIPTLALVDELHRHRSADLYGVFRDGLGPRDGQMITISTAGDDVESPLGLMRGAAYKLPTLEVNGTHRYARSANSDYVMHEWALEPDADRDDLEIVKQANPAPWHSLEALARRHDSPSMTPWQWARFACGVWLQGEDTAIGPVEWAACGADMIPDPGTGIVRIGVDIGLKEDTTGIVAHWIDAAGEAWIGGIRVLVPPVEKGVGLRKRAIVNAIADLAREFGARTVVIDPETGGELIAQDLEDDLGLDVVAHSQKPGPMAQAAERFYSAVSEQVMHHPKDDTFTRHVLNAHRRSVADGRWSFVKESKQSKKHIDSLIAAAMVHNFAIDELTAPVVSREVVFL